MEGYKIGEMTIRSKSQVLVCTLYAWLSNKGRFRLLGWGTLLFVSIAFLIWSVAAGQVHHYTGGRTYPPVSSIQQCQFHELTNLPCPFCGLSRSCAALIRLNVERAVFYHPAGPIFALTLLYAGAIAIVRLSTWKRERAQYKLVLPCRILVCTALSLPAVFLISWLFRLAAHA